MDLIRFNQGGTVLVVQQGSGVITSSAYAGGVLWIDGKASSKQELIGSTVTEDLRLSLKGTTAEIEAALATLARWLEEAARVTKVPGMDWVYLEVRLLATGTIWRSQILGGSMETLGAGAEQRTVKNQGVRLLLQRVNYWEDSTQQELAISTMLDATPAAGGVRITNHWDSGHGNYVQLAAVNVSGDIPAPIYLSLNPSRMTESGTVYAGQNLSANPGTLGLVFEGEDGTAGTSVTKTTLTPEAAGSNGAAGRYAWSTTAARTVVDFALSGATVSAMAGMPYLPVMRIHNSITAGEGFWAYWRIVYKSGGNTDIIYAGKPRYLTNDEALQPGSPLCIPPWKVEVGESPLGLDLQLVISANGSGAHTLDIDYLFLLPLEHWRIYRAIPSSAGGLRIYDNPYSGTVKSYGGLWLHQAEGPGLWAWPGKLQRFYILIEGLSAGGAAISAQSTVRMYYRSRKRAL